MPAARVAFSCSAEAKAAAEAAAAEAAAAEEAAAGAAAAEKEAAAREAAGEDERQRIFQEARTLEEQRTSLAAFIGVVNYSDSFNVAASVRQPMSEPGGGGSDAAQPLPEAAAVGAADAARGAPNELWSSPDAGGGVPSTRTTGSTWSSAGAVELGMTQRPWPW